MGVRALARVSQTRTVPSADDDANTVASLGDHCRSSTEEECPVKGAAASTRHTEGEASVPFGAAPPLPSRASGSHTWMAPAQSPDASLPGTTPLQSSA